MALTREEMLQRAHWAVVNRGHKILIGREECEDIRTKPFDNEEITTDSSRFLIDRTWRRICCLRPMIRIRFFSHENPNPRKLYICQHCYYTESR